MAASGHSVFSGLHDRRGSTLSRNCSYSSLRLFQSAPRVAHCCTVYTQILRTGILHWIAEPYAYMILGSNKPRKQSWNWEQFYLMVIRYQIHNRRSRPWSLWRRTLPRKLKSNHLPDHFCNSQYFLRITWKAPYSNRVIANWGLCWAAPVWVHHQCAWCNGQIA